jgi:hypothetical protein
MSDYFDSLELQLRAAAERPPRGLTRWPDATRIVAATLAVAAAVGVSVAFALAFLGGGDARQHVAATPAPVGTVIPKGEGKPPRSSDSVVVATGRAPVTGPWQLEVSGSSGVKDPQTGEVYLRAGGACLTVWVLDPPNRLDRGGSGYCGPTRELGFRKTPGFSRAQHATSGAARAQPNAGALPAKEVLVFGAVPERATAVVITVRGVPQFRVEPQAGPKGVPGNFYLIPVKPGLGQARINWLDRNSDEGSRGIGLMPPVTSR